LNEKHQKGSASEFGAMQYLTQKGYYIFIRGSVTSPIDIIAIDPLTAEIILIDVKTVSLRLTGKKKGTRINRKLNAEQKKLGVKILYHYGNNKFKFHRQSKKKNNESRRVST